MPLAISPTQGGVLIRIKVVPGASRDRVMGLLGDALKVAVSKPPSGGEANKSVVSVLAAFFGVGARAVTIIAGHASPRKQVRIEGLGADRIAEIVHQFERPG